MSDGIGIVLANKIVDNMKLSINKAEDPMNRIVTDVTFIETDDNLTEVRVTSNCDGWAEDSNKLLFRTVRKFSPEEKDLMKGKSEQEVYDTYYTNELDELIRSLKELYKIETGVHVEEGEKFFNTDKGGFATYVMELCCGLLITVGGSVNYKNLLTLEKAGYDVYAGDKDSFGWLTGCIQKKGDDRILVFG